MQRHPENINLHLFDGETFEGLPVMKDKGYLIAEYLASLKKTIDLALQQYPRLLAFRVDLRFPVGVNLPSNAYTNETLSRFFEYFKATIEHNRACAREHNSNAHDCKVRYVWAREVGQGQRPHYHVLMLLNRDAFYTIGRLGSEAPNMINRMQEAWAWALGLSIGQVSGLVHIPDSAEYRVDRTAYGDVALLPELFYRASYLCKAATKVYGDRQRNFDTSRG